MLAFALGASASGGAAAGAFQAEPSGPTPHALDQTEPSPADGRAGGQPAETSSRPPNVAPLFEQPGILTPRHATIVEPSLEYAYSSSNRVALVGYTIIPALTIGLINVQEVKANTLSGAMTLRYGLSSRWEFEVRLPVVYRNEDDVALPFNTGSSTAVPIVNHATGSGIGDVEATTRYQFNDGGADRPYFIGSLRFKSRTGTDPFEVPTLQSAGGFNAVPLQAQLPTGSGFTALQPGLSMLLPADPAVFFGGVFYLYNFKRHDVVQQTTSNPIPLGTVSGGDIITLDFGMGVALNSRTSFSIGYEQDSVAATQINGRPVPGSTRVELGTLLLGVSYRRSIDSTVIVTVGVGATRDTPGVTLTLRMPFAY